ncbi:M14 family metallopeptidase [Litoribacter populi]|uniref:M14 family metallopeptidase n=1 Tax=Litoribacter populi TaxID=2598460 RepID=UPI00163DCA48|nr:M14 family metallopeptidase [Litoribacter populi]
MKRYFLPLLLILSFQSHAQTTVLPEVPDSVRTVTMSRPVQKQWRGQYEFEKMGVTVSNDFPMGSLNGMFQENDSTLVALITAENTPINESPWYAFQIWGKEEKDIYVRLTYQAGSKHRYYPKISYDGNFWSPLDSANFLVPDSLKNFNFRNRPEAATLKLNVTKDTTWVAGQEIHDSKRVKAWADLISSKPFVQHEKIGESLEGREISALTIGKPQNDKLVMVIARQHPPEVTGQLAMQSFVETLTNDSELSERFRENFTILVVPMVNPDGVDNGHWRHNMHGVDLNRDWADFHQPETRAVKEFMHKKAEENDATFYFGIDFHSTWDDIYYTVGDDYQTGNIPGMVSEWLVNIQSAIPGYEPNISPNNKMEPTLVSRNYFYITFGAESLVYEIGDNTPRDFLEEKSRVAAEEMIKLLLDKVD